MTRTIETTKVCPYCGQPFYLPNDCAEHVKAAHFDFGRRSGIFATLEREEETLCGTVPPPTRANETHRHHLELG
jgi:uncharacterized C2H2 Zn-finger protein